MDCPACNNSLSQIEIDEIKVDICKGGCGGVWFDTFEFKKFDEPHEAAGAELLDIEVNPSIKVDHSERRNCPKCDDITLMRNFFSIKKEVEIDTCAKCAGVWLDAGELNHLRGQYPSEEAKRAAATALFDEMFGPHLEALKKERDENSAKTKRLVNMVKFICPSYYLEGKQDWGSF